eukprot:c53067_g1_i1.p1 GENE.c53067_g1_i1~~c53067_g1_i1.p1  ORF type:complete len:612 (+),score=143.66 c53067_g1_i1:39-1838(+)
MDPNSLFDPYGFLRSSEAEGIIIAGTSFPTAQRIALDVADMVECCNNFSDTQYYQHITQAFVGVEHPFADLIEDELASLVGHKHEYRIKDQVRSALTSYLHRNASVGFSPFLFPVCSVATAATGSDEAAFWALTFFVECVGSDYHDAPYTGLALDLLVFRELSLEFLPTLTTHLNTLNLDISVVLGQWLCCLLAGVLPTRTTVMLWNRIGAARGGTAVMVRALLVLLKTIPDEQISNCKDAVAFVRLITSHAASQLDSELFDASVMGPAEDNEHGPRPLDPEDAETTHTHNLPANGPSCDEIRMRRQQLKDKLDGVAVATSDEISDKSLQKLQRLHTLRVHVDFLELCSEELASRPPGGRITEFEFQNMLRAHGISQAEIARACFDAWDSAEAITCEQLLCGLSLICSGHPTLRLRMCFESYDRDQKGFLDQAQMESMFLSPPWRLFLSLPLTELPFDSENQTPFSERILTRLRRVLQGFEPRGFNYEQFQCFVFGELELVLRFMAGCESRQTVLWKLEASRPRWVPNHEAHRCLNCGDKFTLTTRRHHCRKCGCVFCAKCCDKKVSLPALLGTDERVRVCQTCCLDMIASMDDLFKLM